MIEGDAATAGLPTAHFDVAYLVAVLGEITDPTAAVRQIHDALKPGGRLLISEGWPDPHHQPLDAVKHRVEPLGFTEVTVTRASGRYTAQFRRK